MPFVGLKQTFTNMSQPFTQSKTVLKVAICKIAGIWTSLTYFV